MLYHLYKTLLQSSSVYIYLVLSKLSFICRIFPRTFLQEERGDDEELFELHDIVTEHCYPVSMLCLCD